MITGRQAMMSRESLIRRIDAHAESTPAGELPIDRIADRASASRVVLIGEATHGTEEFYESRAAITRRLIERHGFAAVALEADWPDAASLDRRVRGHSGGSPDPRPFDRFPRWMWRNTAMFRFVRWVSSRNAALDATADRVAIHGLDLYSLYRSIEAVLEYLDRTDADAAAEARERYACFLPWRPEAADYGRAAARGRSTGCAADAAAVLRDLHDERLRGAARHDGHWLFDAERNAATVRDAEEYYRRAFSSPTDSWNLRDRHMFETLRAILDHHGPDSRVVVWAHNSHIGDARATDCALRGDLSLGQLAREHLSDDAHLIGFGFHDGAVTAAHRWGGDAHRMLVPPSHEDGIERLCHDVGRSVFALPLCEPGADDLRSALDDPRPQRAIGVIYRPETELVSHYFDAVLPEQFDQFLWIDRTTAVTPLDDPARTGGGPMKTFPFGE